MSVTAAQIEHHARFAPLSLERYIIGETSSGQAQRHCRAYCGRSCRDRICALGHAATGRPPRRRAGSCKPLELGVRDEGDAGPCWSSAASRGRARPDGVQDLSPQPNLARLDEMVALVVAAGLPVTVQVTGQPRALPPGIELSAYRVIQEALTNALKHAGPARADVCIRYRQDALEITIEDDGPGPPAAPAPTPAGHGLLGMQERVQLFGGDFHTGRGVAGGFRVYARFPDQDPTTSRGAT